MEKLLAEIQQFKRWAEENFPGQCPSEIGWEWETNYANWNMLISAWEQMLKQTVPSTANALYLPDLVYLLARDNECEVLADQLVEYPQWFMVICKAALQSQEPDAKWQLAARLPCLPNRKEAGALLEQFVQDENEYVSRRALMQLSLLLPERVEDYVALFWERNQYGPMQEYQRIAVLDALEQCHSSLLADYLEKAKEDGRCYLTAFAEAVAERSAKGLNS